MQNQNEATLDRQIQNELVGRILRSEWEPGELLPDEKTLATAFRVNPNALRRSLQALRRSRLIAKTVDGKYAVTPDKGTIDALRTDIMQKTTEEYFRAMEALGLKRLEIIDCVLQRGGDYGQAQG